MANLRAGILGSGFIAGYHAKAASVTNGIDIVAVASRNDANARTFAMKHSIGTVHTTYDDLIRDRSLNAVIIGTPNVLHAPQTIAALESGKNVLVEKPMAMDATEAKGMSAAARNAERTLFVGHMWRFDEEVRYLKDAIARGQIGQIFETVGYGVHESWTPSGWFVERKLAGGGALADMGVHAIDTARFLLGSPNPVSVYAKVATRFGDYDVEDSASVLIGWQGGVYSVIESGWGYPHAEAAEAGTRLYGVTGYASLFPTFVTRNDQAANGVVTNPQFPSRAEHCGQGIYDAQMAAFVQSCESGVEKTVGATGEDGAVIMAILDAAYESARTGQVVAMQ